MISRTSSLMLCLSSLAVAFASKCKLPDPAATFTRESYSGIWYEVAKFQTAGGAYFEKNCVCTQLNVTAPSAEKYQADNLCRDKTPEGKLVSAVGSLLNESPKGRFKESFFVLAPSVDYTILFLGQYTNSQGEVEEYSVEYDCGITFLTGYNYCVHFLSRKPTMSEELLQKLISDVNALNLNDENLELQRTKQEGCWNKQSESAII